MALFKTLRGKRGNLPEEKTDGYAYFCIDDGTFWIDYKDDNNIVQRKQINAKEAEELTGMSISNALSSSTTEIPTSKAVSDALSNYATNTSVDTKLEGKVSKAGDTMSGNLAMSNHKITGVAAPAADTDAANKKYVDDAIPTAQIEELSSAVAKAEPFIVEVTMTTSNEISVNKTFSEIKTASDAGKLCYARITNSGLIIPLVAFDLRVDKRVAVFSSSNLAISQFNTASLLIAEDNSVNTENFSSQSLIEASGLLKGSGYGNISAAVAGTDYAAVDHTHPYLPLTGGTLTGNLTGKYITGTWLQTTAASDKVGKIATIDDNGWIYYRTLAETKGDLGISDNLVKYDSNTTVEATTKVNADTLEGHATSYFVPKSGGAMTGALVAQTNTNYTTAQMRNVIISTADPSGGNNGDIWLKYEA